MSDPATVRGLFVAALQVHGDERSALLSRASASARQAVETLLEHDAEAERIRFLERQGWDPALSAGERLGSYVVESLIGEGGMGEVYAVREVESGERYALKLVRLGMDTRRVLARFEVERAALAQMRHPGIAAVIDAGRTRQGQPFFVMELVDGEAIDEFCAHRELPPEEILRLFARVGDAVVHAHRQGVIHRDLKPSNLLVVEGDPPQPKIIDFGLARRVDRDGSSLTLRGEVLGTPEFMSPEQLAGAPTDTRTDVHALGAILHVMVTGERPERGEGGEVRRIPSARGRGRSWPGRLAKDVDGIVAMATATRPEDRYDDVGHLVADVRSAIAGAPVRARGANRRNALRNLWWQHRVAMTVMVMLTACLVAGVVGLAAGLADVAEARRRADEMLEQFHQLGFGVRLQRAAVEQARLHPAWPEQVPALEHWLQEHGAPLRSDAGHVSVALAEVRRRALPQTPDMRERDRQRFARERAQLKRMIRRREHLDATATTDEANRLDGEIAALREVIQQPASYSFADERDHVLHDGLAHLHGAVRRELHPDFGMIARVEARLRWARTIRTRSIERFREAWERAIAAVSADPRFGGYRLTPQIGLVPLGADPVTGLQEFGHLRSGQVPARDGEGRLVLDGRSGVVFVLLPGGRFVMGGEPNGLVADVAAMVHEDERPRHVVELAAFFCAKHEMTGGQWARLQERSRPLDRLPPPQDADDEARPVRHVAWGDVVATLDRHGIGLPTEAQWEFACSGGVTGPWWAGNDPERAERELVREQREPSAAFVGPANPFGLVNVSGNVAEWCRDAYGSYRGPARVGDGLREFATGTDRVVRGGSWTTGLAGRRSSARQRRPGARASSSVGCRPVRAVLP